MHRALLVAALVVGALGSEQRTIKLPHSYHTATNFVAYAPARVTEPLPLVIMLSGYCLDAQLQDNVRRTATATATAHCAL